MDKAAIINEVVNDSNYLQYCREKCGGKDIYKDLYQYLILTLLEMPEEKLVRIYKYGNLRGYITRIIYANATYNNTTFYKQYNELPTIQYTSTVTAVDDYNEDEEIKFDYKIKKVEEVIEKEKKEFELKEGRAWNIDLFNLYVEYGSAYKVSQLTKIPYRTVKDRVFEIKKKIIENVSSNE